MITSSLLPIVTDINSESREDLRILAVLTLLTAFFKEGRCASGGLLPTPHFRPSSLYHPLGVIDAVVPLATVVAVTLKCYYQTVQMGPAVSSSLHSEGNRKSH